MPSNSQAPNITIVMHLNSDAITLKFGSGASDFETTRYHLVDFLFGYTGAVEAATILAKKQEG